MAKSDCAIKLAGVDGEAEEQGREGHIDVLGWSWGMAWNAGLFQGSQKGGADVRNLTFVHYVDAASPPMMSLCFGGKVIPTVVLKQFKAAGSAELNYLTITLGEARITSIDCNLDGPEVQPTERITLAFRTLKVEHATQGVKGSGKNTKTFEWRIRDQD